MSFVRFRLLLVDDDADALRVLEGLFGTTFDVVVASDGAEAIGHLQAQEFSAVLTDLAMPRIDGVTLVRWIEANRPALAACTFVVTGGATDARQREWLASFDVHRLFMKPIEPSVVIHRIHAAITDARS